MRWRSHPTAYGQHRQLPGTLWEWRFKSSSASGVGTVSATPPAQVAAAPPPASDPAPQPDTADPSGHPGIVPSPMVGTVYLQAEPGTPPFVSIGDAVTEGQTVLIIEAMKTMNQIPAPRAGKVTRILVEDSTPVEFGAPLLIIE